MGVKLAIPNKGRLHEPTVNLLRRAGLKIEDSGRLLYGLTSNPNVEVIFVRASDIPGFVGLGAADLGVTGYDYIVESKVEVVELLDLKFGRASIVVAAPEGGVESIDEVTPGAVVATKYVNIARSFFESKGIDVSILKVSGAAEVIPYLGVADLIVDVTSTGTTLRVHRLKILAKIMDTSARLIANPRSLQEKKDLVEEVCTALESVVRAEGMKLIMMNVPDEKLEAVVSVLPAMAGPTIAEVKSKPKMWEVYSVVSEEDVYRVVSEARKAGARDIIVIPIERVLP